MRACVCVCRRHSWPHPWELPVQAVYSLEIQTIHWQGCHQRAGGMGGPGLGHASLLSPPTPHCPLPPRAHLHRQWISLCPSCPTWCSPPPLAAASSLCMSRVPPPPLPARTGLRSHLDVPSPLVGLVGHLLLHAGQLLLQVGHLILVKLGQVIELLLQPLIPGRGTRCDGSPGPLTSLLSIQDQFHSSVCPACSALFRF